MTNTISLETSIRLNELGLLDNIETEFVYIGGMNGEYNKEPIPRNSLRLSYFTHLKDIPTLTHEEMLSFIEKLGMFERYANYIINFAYKYGIEDNIELHEKILTYLLDNNLIGTK